MSHNPPPAPTQRACIHPKCARPAISHIPPELLNTPAPHVLVCEGHRLYLRRCGQLETRKPHSKCCRHGRHMPTAKCWTIIQQMNAQLPADVHFLVAGSSSTPRKRTHDTIAPAKQQRVISPVTITQPARVIVVEPPAPAPACGICLEPVVAGAAEFPRCSHGPHMHTACVERWKHTQAAVHPTCPLCREPLTPRMTNLECNTHGRYSRRTRRRRTFEGMVSSDIIGWL